MTGATARAERTDRLARGAPFDLLVIGGGIAGAGIALEAAHAGARVALLEARDFASGTSSRSSKLVHGGLRYLKQGRLGLTRESVRERDALLAAAPGLVEPLPFLVPFGADSGSAAAVGILLALYDAFAGRRSRAWLDPAELLRHVPGLFSSGLRGGWRFLDAVTDDARLTLRVIAEAERFGALCLNHAPVTGLLREGDARPVAGVRVEPEGGPALELRGRCVINATGSGADRLRGQVGLAPMLRPLRGSHLLLPAWRFPVAQVVAMFHPDDRRPVYAMPWEGGTLVGTTDLDHDLPADAPASIHRDEVGYLMRALQRQFPALGLGVADVRCTWSGVRPVVSSNRGLAPSKENREHLVVEEHGLVTVAGGKLTTFRSTALRVLDRLHARLPELRPRRADAAVFAPEDDRALRSALDPALAARWHGRYGADATRLLADAPEARMPLAPSLSSRAELRHACRHEQVLHLDDLLLRRTRLGFAFHDGALARLPALRGLIQPELGWDEARWNAEVERYAALWQREHAVPA